MSSKRKDNIVETRIQISVAARDALNNLSASRKRKGALVNDLLLAAQERLEAYKQGNAPIDAFTHAILRAQILREERLAKSGGEDEADA